MVINSLLQILTVWQKKNLRLRCVRVAHKCLLFMVNYSALLAQSIYSLFLCTMQWAVAEGEKRRQTGKYWRVKITLVSRNSAWAPTSTFMRFDSLNCINFESYRQNQQFDSITYKCKRTRFLHVRLASRAQCVRINLAISALFGEMSTQLYKRSKEAELHRHEYLKNWMASEDDSSSHLFCDLGSELLIGSFLSWIASSLWRTEELRKALSVGDWFACAPLLRYWNIPVGYFRFNLVQLIYSLC